MLKSLCVKNFAIIEDITIDFKPGMTVLTGQTGAGKSLLIDSISLILGSRADTDMIRYGSNEAYLSALFDYNNNRIDELLEKYNIKKCSFLHIERFINPKKSVIKINDSIVNLQILNSITLNLADLHSQTDTLRLFNKENYLSFIDVKDDQKYLNLLNDYIISRESYLNEYDVLSNILNKKNKSSENLEYLKASYNEIKLLNLRKDIDIELNEKINKMKNFDKIFNSLKDAYDKLENEYFNLDNIYNAYTNVHSIENYDKKYKDSADNLDTAYNLASEALQSIKSSLENLDYNPDLINMLTSELNEIENMCLKYHRDVDGLIKYQEELKIDIDMSLNYDEVIKEHENKLNELFNVTLNKALKLSEYRKEEAKIISKEIIKECNDLELPHTDFSIDFYDNKDLDYHNKDIFSLNGIDDVEFMISLNLGEPKLPLYKVASGGEMSRIMLAFKSFFAKRSNLSLMVFDEIDTGVSGKVATEIAKKMKNITKYNQVLAITHLPQVASIADNQIFIYKEENNNRTITKVKELNNEDRIVEIAKMISGEKVSPFALEAAKEMLQK